MLFWLVFNVIFWPIAGLFLATGLWAGRMPANERRTRKRTRGTGSFGA